METRKNAATYINQDSGNVEYYTPSYIIEAAREVMGNITLDPASSAGANLRVQATFYFDQHDDGLMNPWRIADEYSMQPPSNVWMNHPFARGQNKLWIDKLMAEYKCGNVEQACCITFASTSEAWFQPLYSFPICFIRTRVNYLLPSGEVKRGVTKGSCVTYFGGRVSEFQRVFGKLGAVMLPG